MAPLKFLRALGCVDDKLRKDRRSKACKGFKPATLDGIAYHPHTGVRAPTNPPPSSESATVANLGRMFKTIDAIQTHRRADERPGQDQEVRHVTSTSTASRRTRPIRTRASR